MEHIFLTGEIQVGKTTALRRALGLLGVSPGGFQTCFGPDRASPDRLLYLCPAGDTPVYRAENAIARFSGGALTEIYLDRFDGMGAQLLRAARRDSPLILMDECGRFEQEAYVFRAEVTRCLDGERPVLGVLRLRKGCWTEELAAHPRVRLLTVTEENRDALPRLLFERYRHMT